MFILRRSILTLCLVFITLISVNIMLSVHSRRNVTKKTREYSSMSGKLYSTSDHMQPMLHIHGQLLATPSKHDNQLSKQDDQMFNWNGVQTPPSEPPKLVVLLAYQRVGSTFIGQLLNMNPKVFNMFEPLDGMYTDMYGTSQGWNVPTDIAFFTNGTKRVISSKEENKILDTLDAIFTCDVRNLPLDVLVHKYFSLYDGAYKKAKKYLQCVKTNDFHQGLTECRTNIQKLRVCPRQFGKYLHLQQPCADRIERMHKQIKQPDTGFQKFQTCRNGVQDKLEEKCLPLLHQACTSSSLITIKTVRLNMKTARMLYKRFPNVRIVHLFRDPRAVIASRKKGASFHGLESTTVSEAAMYCMSVLSDVILRQDIEQQFPGTTYQMTYEDFNMDPTEGVNRLYDFLQEKVPMEVTKWLRQNTRNNNNTDTVEKWQTLFSFGDVYKIDKACKELYSHIKHPWQFMTNN